MPIVMANLEIDCKWLESTNSLHKDTISNGRCVEPHREVEDESMEKCSYLHK